jgi:hypothetical protein
VQAGGVGCFNGVIPQYSAAAAAAAASFTFGSLVPKMTLTTVSGAEILEEDKVTYVNPKQYYRILRRREARAKLIAQGKVPEHRERKVCI